MDNNKHSQFMQYAIIEAQKGHKYDEIPIGCVIVCNNQVIAAAANSDIEDSSPLSHAEIKAIEKAHKIYGAKLPQDAAIYVTLEPCLMCLGAIHNSRIKRLYYGAENKLSGVCGGWQDLTLITPPYNKGFLAFSSVLEEECSQLLTNYFKKIRQK